MAAGMDMTRQRRVASPVTIVPEAYGLVMLWLVPRVHESQRARRFLFGERNEQGESPCRRPTAGAWEPGSDLGAPSC
jgi:hypothetical protein